MPMEEGSSKEAIGKNVAKMIREGKPRDQAVAIAHSKAGKSKPKKKKKDKPGNPHKGGY